MGVIYGYCRISTAKQKIDRQVSNILNEYPDAVIVREVFTGKTTDGRKEWCKLFSKVSEGDTIVFDEASRMARNAEEGYSQYEELFCKGVNLIFLKEPHINTETYRQAIEKKLQVVVNSGDDATDELMTSIIKALNQYILALAKKQIYLAFQQAQKEVEFLSQRTKNGLAQARLNGKQIGHIEGTKLTTKKSVAAKEIILKHSKDFNGALNDLEMMKLTGLARNTYYKYKRELKDAEYRI